MHSGKGPNITESVDTQGVCIPFHLLTNPKTFAGLLPSFHFTSTAKPKLKPITSSWPGHLSRA